MMRFAAVEAEQVGVLVIVVEVVGLFVAEVLADVFHDQRAFADAPGV